MTGYLTAAGYGEAEYEDKRSRFRFSHENPQIQRLYREFLGKPLSPKAEALLHTDHFGWKM